MAEAADLKNIDTKILDTINAEKGKQMWSQAQKDYPYLAKKDIAFKYTPTQNHPYMLEFYQQGDLPDWAKGKKTAVEVFNPKTRPIDILGDYVSHYGVSNDPKLKAYYQKFAGQLSPEMMKQRYQYHVQHLNENRPYQTWYDMTGLPEIFRGYTFNQWGDRAKEMYTPEQLKTLDQVKAHLGIK